LGAALTKLSRLTNLQRLEGAAENYYFFPLDFFFATFLAAFFLAMVDFP
jgi:hypothetical protein